MNKNLLTFIFLLLSGVAVAQYAGLPSLAGSSTTSDGGSSGSEYWFDAGAGFIATNATVAGLAVTDAGMIIQGVALFVTDGGTRSDIQMRTGSTIQGTLRASANTVAGHIVGLNMSLPSGKSFSIYTEASSGTTTVFRDYGTAEFNQSSGNSAIQFNSSGARLDFGPTSSLDYIASDATGIGTAGYFKFGAYTDAGLPAAAAGNLGATAYGSSTGGLKLSNGVTWIDIGASGGGSSVNYWYDGGVMSLNGSSRGTIFTDSFIRNPDAGASLSVTGSTAGVAIGTALHITNNVDGQSVGSAIAFGVGDVNPTQAVSWTFASSASNGGINAGTNNQSNSPFHWSIGAGAPGTATTRVQSITGSAINGYFPFTSQVASTVNGFECATTGCRIDTGPGTDNYFVGDGTGIETPGYLEIGGYTQGATGFCTGTACAGTAFASFPAAAGVSSRLLYDATNQAYRATGRIGRPSLTSSRSPVSSRWVSRPPRSFQCRKSKSKTQRRSQRFT